MKNRSTASEQPQAGRFTAARPLLSATMIRASERVVSLLRESDVPLNTYDILRRLNAVGLPLRPPQAYRLVDRLSRQGLIHRVESQAAFVACRIGCSRVTASDPQLLVCSVCGRVSELRSRNATALLTRIATRGGLRPRRQIVEIVGTCKTCAAKP